MAYSNIWNASFEASPSGTTGNVADGDDIIRELKLAIRERMQKDHYFDPSGTDADHGEHKKVTLRVCSTPDNVADKGFLYAKNYNSKAELHYLDEDNNEVLLTKSGSVASSFQSGTKMLFYQDTAPEGWTIENTLNDKLVFISKGSAAGGQTGGAAHSSGTWTRTQTTTIPKDGWSVSLGSTSGYLGGGTTQLNQYYGSTGYLPHIDTDRDLTATNSSWRPAAYVCIICSKD
ncbi:MAG: hypothetical protein OCU18_03925 [Candidatus Syntrophoarchaeum sp.]|nr:hypothetical protein [Candidatus Syntrophoarchaeum sp.]